jgi:signal transduction histidine kinase
MRPVHIVFNLALWSLLFVFGGFSVGIRISILLLALLTSSGSIVELLLIARVYSRILKPIEALEAAAARVAAGDFEVRVDPSQASEIGGLVMAFNDMAAALKRDQELAAQYERDRKDLVANISHDLKTPIASIQGYIEAMEDDRLDDPERRKRYLRIVRANASYMNKLIDDLFLFSRLDMRKLDFHFLSTLLKPFMRDLVEELALDVEEVGARFSYKDGIDEGATARLDAKRFQQVLRNIVDNAVKYGPEANLALDVVGRTEDGHLIITVADNGPGIPEDKMERLFERFYRIESERTKDFSSTGLGLAIARELIEAHGGKLSAANAEGGGALFRIELPLLEEEA